MWISHLVCRINEWNEFKFFDHYSFIGKSKLNDNGMQLRDHRKSDDSPYKKKYDDRYDVNNNKK